MQREEKIKKITEKYSSPPDAGNERDEYFMRCALELAEAAAEEDEVPVGAVVVRDGAVVAADYNGREGKKNALYHAETAAIARACAKLGGWRLPGCEIFVTLEPCAMCAGAILNARIERTVFGARDPKYGAFGSVADLGDLPLGHRTKIAEGVLAGESAALLRRFFAGKREKKETPVVFPAGPGSALV